MANKDNGKGLFRPSAITGEDDKIITKKLVMFPDDCSIMGFVRLPTLVKLLGVSKTTIYKEIREGRFPRHVRLSPRVSAWRISDLIAHFDNIDSRQAE